MRWAENVARIGRIGMHIGYCLESRKERAFGKTKTYVKYEGTVVPKTKQNKLHGLSPRANYTDRATAACRRSDCQLVRIEVATWSA
jgi:hypothetical protein